jgi:hypothetical protein
MSVSSKFLSLWEKKAGECYDYAISFLRKFEVAKEHSIVLVQCKDVDVEIIKFTEAFFKKHNVSFVQKVKKGFEEYQILCWDETTVKLKGKDLTDELDVLSNKVYEIMEQIDKAKDTCLALKNVHPLILDTLKDCISIIKYNDYLLLMWKLD